MTPASTSPLAAGMSHAAAGAVAGQTFTSPSLGSAGAVDVAAVSSGNASKYWIELVAYPPGSARSLWLYVNNVWKHLDNPSASIQDVVQRAFLGSGSNVRVWFDDSTIVGLVVEGS